jgi:hypothetical protein
MSSSSTTFTLADTLFLEWLEWVPMPILLAAFRHYGTDYCAAWHHDNMYHTTIHTAMVAQGMYAYGQTIQTVLCSFANREPNRAGLPTSSLPYIPHTLTPELILPTSPEPLPVTSWVMTPFPADPLPDYNDEPPRYTAQRSPSLIASKNTAISQDQWINNLPKTGPLHDVMVPTGQGSVMPAPLTHYDFDTDLPKLLATHGGNSPTYLFPLHAYPKPYHCRHFLKKKQYLFNPLATHTNQLMYAVRKENDITLQAEIHYYQAKYVETQW